MASLGRDKRKGTAPSQAQNLQEGLSIPLLPFPGHQAGVGGADVNFLYLRCRPSSTGFSGALTSVYCFCALTSASIRVVRYSRMSPYAASIKLCAAGLMDARQASSAFRAASFCASQSNFPALFSEST